jgi:hypothetical protein
MTVGSIESEETVVLKKSDRLAAAIAQLLTSV